MKPIIGITADMDEQAFNLRHDYVLAIQKSGGVPVILTPPISAPPLEKEELKGSDINRIADLIDGLLLSGGNDLSTDYYSEGISVPKECLKIAIKERSDFEIALLKAVMEKQKPILGICYGMQLMNVAFGGSLYQDIGHQIKGALNHRKGRHDIKIIEPEILNLQLTTFSVNSSHHQAVKKLGEGLQIFAIAEDGVVEGFYKKGYYFALAVQWHPERIFYDKLSLGIFKLFIEKAGYGS